MMVESDAPPPKPHQRLKGGIADEARKHSLFAVIQGIIYG